MPNYTNPLLFFFVLLGIFIFHPLKDKTSKIPEQTPKQSNNLNQQGIQVTDYEIEALIKDVFLKGACKNISNISLIGSEAGIGHFSGGSSVISIEEGFILSSGHFESAVGPNEDTDFTGTIGNSSGDTDLNMIATGTVFDAVGIEFDFVPLRSSIEFRFVFASEEYCEFVGSEFNDVFGFFVSGPGIEGEFSNQAKNIATIPGSGDLVSINSINHINNTSYYVSNVLAADAYRCEVPDLVSPFIEQIQYDGFTKPINANIQVIPCETYHMRLVVADVSDNFYDSAIFLKSKSFDIGGNITVRAEVEDNPDNIAYEGCSNSYFVFERAENASTNQDFTVNLKIVETSTAIEGVDFETLPESVTLSAGEDAVYVPVTIISDNLAESQETLQIELDYDCECIQDTTILFISDALPVVADLDDQTVCPTEIMQLEANISNGVPPFQFFWSNGDTSQILEIIPTENTYSLTITDACGTTDEATCNLSYLNAPTAIISGYAEVCQGNNIAFLNLIFEGTPPYELTYSIDGQIQPTITNIFDNAYALEVSQAGQYEIVEFRDVICTGYTEGFGEIEEIIINVSHQSNPVSCFGGNDGTIQVSVSGGLSPYRYDWGHITQDSTVLNNLTSGIYQLTVTDANGCQSTTNIEIDFPEALAIIGITCEEILNQSIDFTASGGTPPYNYSIDEGQQFQDESLFEQLVPGESYQLWIRDANACQNEQDFVMPKFFETLVTLESVVTIPLGERLTLSPQLAVPESLIAQITWSPSEYLSCTDCLEPFVVGIQETDLSLQVSDIFGCETTIYVHIEIDKNIQVYIPTAFSPHNGDDINDRFFIFAKNTQVAKITYFRVFDRWGTMVYEAQDFLPNDRGQGWDGTFRQQNMQPGLYVYGAEMELIDGSTVFYKGEVTLVY